MVAKIKIDKNVGEVIRYNERKCQSGKAECLMASGFLKDEMRLSVREKITRFERLHEKNIRTKKNTLHTFVSFSPEENLSREKLTEIASRYLEQIGFGEQPFLVYLHKDTKIQHLHLVSSIIEESGRRMDVHNIGRNKSSKARRNIEQEFGLVKAEARGKLKKLLKEPQGKALKKLLDALLLNPKIDSLDTLVAALKLREVDAHVHKNAEGRIFGITFLDNRSKASFKGSELGKAYSVSAILKRIENKERVTVRPVTRRSSIPFSDFDWKKPSATGSTPMPDPLANILSGSGYGGQAPAAAYGGQRRKKRRKKKRNL